MMWLASDAWDGWYLFITAIVVLGWALDPFIDWLAAIIARRRERRSTARGR